MFYNFVFILQYLFFTLGSEIAKSDNCVNMSLYFYAFLEVRKEKEYMIHEKCKTVLEFHKVLHISKTRTFFVWRNEIVNKERKFYES